MSANPRSNLRLNVRRNRRSSRRVNNNSANTTAIARGPSTNINPDNAYRFQRRSVDITIAMQAGGGLQIQQPPGFTGTQYVTFGAPVPDAAIVGLPLTSNVPFQVFFDLTSLADGGSIKAFWNEWQYVACRLEIESLQGDSWFPGTAYGCSPIPEVITAPNPDLNLTVVGITPVSVMAYANCQRSVVTLARPHRTRFIPRPNITDPNSVPGVISNRPADFWFCEDVPVGGCIGIIRNMMTPIAAAQPTFPLRFSLTVDVRARRPR